jgi:hypothetical protein
LLNGEFNALPLLQIPKAVAPNCRVVDKDVFASFSLDEAITFGSVEPLDSSSYSL